MNNHLCPFCNHVLRVGVAQEYKKGKETIQEIHYCCEDEDCKKLGPQNHPRWDFMHWEGREINYYRAHMSYAGKHYIIQGSSNAWTRLFYDAPNMGAMVRSPIMEMPYIPLQEPLLDHLETILKKMMMLIIFT